MQANNTLVLPVLPYLLGGGEMGERIRNHRWETTSMGSPEHWPHSLQTAISLLLHSRFPMFIWWGPDLISFYNDAYIHILGDKHPTALGQPGAKVWEEIWDVVGSLADRVMAEGKSNWAEDQLLYINRNGKLEETYFTFSSSPLYNESGNVAGVFCACTETTEKVFIARRLLLNQQNLHNMILQAPVAMCIFKGDDFIVEIGNDKMFELWGKTKEEMLSRPVFEALPEAKNQGFEELIQAVYKTGETFTAYAVPINLPRGNEVQTVYVNLVYEAFKEGDGTISGVMAVAIDVTTQVVNQKLIEESAQEVQTMVANAPFPIGVYTGREMRIKHANQTIKDVWGKGDAVVGKLYADILPELDNQSIFQQLDDVFTTGIPFHAKNARVDLFKEGKLQPFYFNYSLIPLFDNKGKVYGVMNTAAEITELTLALQKIKEAEEKARLAIESAELGTYELDLKTNDLTTSPRFEKIWGQKGQIVGREGYAATIYPDDLPIRNEAMDLAFKTGNLYYEVRIVPDEGMRWVRVMGKIIYDEKNQPFRLLGVVQDVTEQKLFAEELGKQVKERTSELETAQATLVHSNNYLQNIINKFETALASLVPVFKGDKIADFRFKMTNEAYGKYANLSPQELQGKIVSEIFPGYQQSEAFEKYIDTYLTGKTSKWDLHYNLDDLNVHLTVTCYRMDDEVLVHFTDFTTLKNLQLELLKNIEELSRSNRNLEDFAYAASHDLKEPIRKIHFFSDKLKNEINASLNEKQLNLFTKLENATLRMRTLVDDLLSYSQVNLHPIQFEKVDLKDLLNIVLSDLELEVQEKNATIHIGEMPVIDGYPRQLQQLFQNLLSNALKYRSEERPLVISISASQIKGIDSAVMLSMEEKKRNYYKITVADNGIGFNQENAELIFQVFQRLHGNAEYRGTGVGLSIARKVAENHKGFIWANASPGEGARFDVLFPIPE